MSNDSVTKLIQPGTFDDQLTDVLRNGARALLAQAVEAEVADFLGRYSDLKTSQGHRRVVRHGHLCEREVMTGIGPVAVRRPRVDLAEVATAGSRKAKAHSDCRQAGRAEEMLRDGQGRLIGSDYARRRIKTDTGGD